MAFIPESHLPNLAKHKFQSTGYSSFDNVLNYVLWEPLVQYFPKTLAPNLITFIGLLFMIASYVIMLPYDTTFQIECPACILVLSGIFQFFYQTLDACDGKQARRLGLASPLGMLMDHGCDSLSCTLLLLSLVQGLGLGLTTNVFILFCVIQSGFFLTHWEEYHTHYHRTQMFNWGVTEGQWTNIAVLWITAVTGAQYWQSHVLGYRLEDIMIFANCAWGGSINLLMIFNTLAKLKGLKPVLRLLPIVLMNVSLYLWFSSEFMLRFGFLVMVVHGLIFAKVNSKLIICSTSVMDFDWMEANILVEFAFVLFERAFGLGDSAFFGFCGFVVLNYLVFVYSVINQLARFLKISIFTVN